MLGVFTLVQDLVGVPCQRVENPHGSVLSVDFGALGRRTDDPESARMHGWRHLTVLAPWRIETRTAVVCDWNVEGGPSGRIGQLSQALVGQRVVAAVARPPGWDLRIEFEGDLSLVVFGDATTDREDAWFILGTDGAEGGGAPVWGA